MMDKDGYSKFLWTVVENITYNSQKAPKKHRSYGTYRSYRTYKTYNLTETFIKHYHRGAMSYVSRAMLYERRALSYERRT